MSSPDDDFEPPAAVLDVVLSSLLAPELRRFEDELARPIEVLGHTTVHGKDTTTWRVSSSRRDGVPLAVEARATFRKTGGRHVQFRVQVRAPRSTQTTWTGLTLEGRVRPDEMPIRVEPRGKTVLHNQTEWLKW